MNAHNMVCALQFADTILHLYAAKNFEKKNAGDNTYRYIRVRRKTLWLGTFVLRLLLFFTIFLNVKYFCTEYLLHTIVLYTYMYDVYLGYLNTHQVYIVFFSCKTIFSYFYRHAYNII